MNVIASTAMVTTRPCARSTPAMPPAWSMRDSTQPPKMSPLALVSAGMALMRTVSSPRGVSESDVVVIEAVPLPGRCYIIPRATPAGAVHARHFQTQGILGHLLSFDLGPEQARRLREA